MSKRTTPHQRPKQTARVYAYMLQNGSITTLDAMLDLGVLRLASRISELKRAGIPIQKDWTTVKNRFGEDCKVLRYSIDKGGEDG